jgi:hypothetical protein
MMRDGCVVELLVDVDENGVVFDLACVTGMGPQANTPTASPVPECPPGDQQCVRTGAHPGPDVGHYNNNRAGFSWTIQGVCRIGGTHPALREPAGRRIAMGVLRPVPAPVMAGDGAWRAGSGRSWRDAPEVQAAVGPQLDLPVRGHVGMEDRGEAAPVSVGEHACPFGQREGVGSRRTTEQPVTLSG